MKHVILFLISILSLSCSGQNQDFFIYLSNFRNMALPFTIDRRDTSTRIFPTGVFKKIPEVYIKKFICKDPSNCKIDLTNFGYDYGIKFNISPEFLSILFVKQRYEGSPDCDFDLSEIILVTYTKQGKIISIQSIGKNNDCWLSTIKITSEKISVQQIKVLEFNKPEMNCEIQTKEYKVNKEGIIENTLMSPPKKGIVIMDKRTEDFKLK
ncbi:MAG: hypothetical protein Q8908_13595 [Bacteroidota bacterium]|nr:hypothetical protein [Bacteroidota bacterium]